MTRCAYLKIPLCFLLLTACIRYKEPDNSAEAQRRFEIAKIKKNIENSRVQIQGNSLVVDGQEVPQLWGAELQYFRLRGGQAKNIDPSVVRKLWINALQSMKDAGMNAIGFYIPWDFHEYAEGQYDFNGTHDGDNDGKADYPSRDLIGFLKLVTSAPFNFKYIMARPGPYINAEWGFLGFGAIPEWFHTKFPHTHMQGNNQSPAKLYDYNSPELLTYTKKWFKNLHSEVLKDYIGPGKPIIAMQIDNETNYQWQSLYNVDYSHKNQLLFRDYLKEKYQKIEILNQSYEANFSNWSQIQAPQADSPYPLAKKDWYEFLDVSVYKYLQKIQKAWVELGVTHKDVLFTLAESYNAAPFGQIPNLNFRNDPTTGMQTVNLYPKTNEHPKDPLTNEYIFPVTAPQTTPSESPLFNDPFKADHDVRLADAANDAYSGSKNEWVMGPEIQTGWWSGTHVRNEARLQTWLKMFGHGNKWPNLYYFTEGDNWDADWEIVQIQKIFDEIRRLPQFADIPENTLFDYEKTRPANVEEFWALVSDTYRKNVFFYSEEDKHWTQWKLRLEKEEKLMTPLKEIVNSLRASVPYSSIAEADLYSYSDDRPEIVNDFWREVLSKYEAQVVPAPANADKHWALWNYLNFRSHHDLYFDAPLDKNAKQKSYFSILANMGKKVMVHAKWLGKATEDADSIVFLKDSADHSPKDIPELDNVQVNTSWSAGLYAYLLHAGYNPFFSAEKVEIENAKVVVRYDYRRKVSDSDLTQLKNFVSSGGLLINFLEDTLASQFGIASKESSRLSAADRVQSLQLSPHKIIEADARFKPQYARSYEKLNKACSPLLYWGSLTVAYSCKVGSGKFIQLGVSLHDIYNSHNLYRIGDLTPRNAFLKELVAPYVENKVEVQGPSKVVAFSRSFENKYWVTLISNEKDSSLAKLSLPNIHFKAPTYKVTDVLTGNVLAQGMSAAQLKNEGIGVNLTAFGSTAITIEAE